MRIEIKSQEYKIFDLADDLVLYTTELNNEIACSFFSRKLKKVALARNIDKKQLQNLIAEINPNHVIEDGLIEVKITGGDKSDESSKYLDYIIEALNAIDNNTNVINIIVFDTCKRLHPNSIELDCYHGGIRSLDG
jgi:L-lysine 2,3-aminomutase